jgi:hypothetical protein
MVQKQAQIRDKKLLVLKLMPYMVVSLQEDMNAHTIAYTSSIQTPTKYE